jgi:hypothetical protein
MIDPHPDQPPAEALAAVNRYLALALWLNSSQAMGVL